MFCSYTIKLHRWEINRVRTLARETSLCHGQTCFCWLFNVWHRAPGTPGGRWKNCENSYLLLPLTGRHHEGARGEDEGPPCCCATVTHASSSSVPLTCTLLSINPARHESHSQVISISLPHMLSGVASVHHHLVSSLTRSIYLYIYLFIVVFFFSWQAAVFFADAMFEQWAWRKIISSTATWRASPSGSISPRTRWVSLCLCSESKGCRHVCSSVLFFVLRTSAGRESKWRLSRWTNNARTSAMLCAVVISLIHVFVQSVRHILCEHAERPERL